MSKIENSELYMSKEKFKEVLDHYREKPFFVGMDGGDLEYIFDLVEDLLAAERDALKEEESYATHSIDRLEAARHEVFVLGLDMGDAYEEVYGNG